jgi:hypothetical protein
MGAVKALGIVSMAMKLNIFVYWVFNMLLVRILAFNMGYGYFGLRVSMLIS